MSPRCSLKNKVVFFIIVLLAVAITYTANVYLVKNEKISKNKQRPQKYILLWTPRRCSTCAPFNSFSEGRYAFKRMNCSYSNCYITDSRTLLEDYTKFDAVLFNGRHVANMDTNKLPERRNNNQLYVFVQLESADRFPVCNKNFDHFFNRTFTYKLDSDLLWSYMDIKNMDGQIIGPKVNMTWIPHEDMVPVSQEFGDKLKRKSVAAAWFVSNCHTRSRREKFVLQLEKELARFNLTVDIYGKCGNLSCSRTSRSRRPNTCDSHLQQDYYFYLSFENSFSEDYVTEKLLTGLLNDAVPVVYGGADYTRFLPTGSYIDARRLGVTKTAQAIYEATKSHSRYQDMFRWRQHYQYTPRWPPPLCSLCQQLHETPTLRTHHNFREWWFPGYKKRCRLF